MSRKVLILGAGELGTAIITAILDHESFEAQIASLTVAVRQETLTGLESSTEDVVHSSRSDIFASMAQRGAKFTSIDLVNDSEESIRAVFSQYTTIIHAGAMTLPVGTQLRITKAALAAEVPEYVPWQWGVDYDVIGPEAGGGLFAEAYQVRQVLRAQQTTKWWIVSCGVFMSFLFEEFWGVVPRKDKKVSGVRALGGWDHLVTATHVEDIAKVNAELLLVDHETRDRAVYVAGVTLRYDELANEIERVLQRTLTREVWTSEELQEQILKMPDDKILQYRVVFSGEQGLAWRKEGDYVTTRNITLNWNIERFIREQGIQ